MINRNVRRVESVLFAFFVVVSLLIAGCTKHHGAEESVDAVLIGGGIMSATLASMLKELDSTAKIHVYERLPNVAQESSAALNNAGTGHAAFCELNYTPVQPDGSVSIKKAIDVSEAFELAKSYWAYLVSIGVLQPSRFIHNVPHMSFVFGDENVSFLKKRYETMITHPLFKEMEYTENHAEIKTWAPLVMEGRKSSEKIAATRVMGGVDVDFGSLTEALFDGARRTENFSLNVMHDVKDITRNSDGTWTVDVTDLVTQQKKSVRTKFVFIGAGGGALHLLKKSGIAEADGFGGFPVGGAWLVTDREELINKHIAKVYGKASVGSPPMSVPHLDTRFINGKKSLLFGPFAIFSTKFLKNGSWLDLPTSVSLDNVIPMVQVGFNNLNLVSYLISQVMLSKEEQIASLKEYVPNAHIDDWRFEIAGQRVQVIKKDKDKGGILQFGTELVSAHDKSLVALLGASPGASTAVQTMLKVLEMSFADKVARKDWQEKLRLMLPSYGQKLADDAELVAATREHNRKLLALEN